jgi:hypothetical protein
MALPVNTFPQGAYSQVEGTTVRGAVMPSKNQVLAETEVPLETTIIFSLKE